MTDRRGDVLLGVYSPHSSWYKRRDELGQRLKLPSLSESPLNFPPQHFILVIEDTGLALQGTGKGASGPIQVDFVTGASAHRRVYGGGKSQLIAKAVGLKSAFLPEVLDLTAGLGQDAFVLATLGCSLTMLERVPLVFYLLADGLERGLSADDESLKTIMGNMNLLQQDARQYLQSLQQAVDVIYLDPMFPSREKSAKVKKSMAAFHQLVGSDMDAGEVLKLALTKARYRVVVKRARKAPSLDQQYPDVDLPAPSLVLTGKSSRYDVYPLAKMPAKLASPC